MVFAVIIFLLLSGIIYWGTFSSSKKSAQKRLIKPIADVKKEALKEMLPPAHLTEPANQPVEQQIYPELSKFRLLTLKESDKQTLDQIVKITKSIPRPHPILNVLLAGGDNTDELYEMVQSDPVIAAKVLQAVNSGGFYLTQKITRLNQAILFLGANRIKSIAFQCAITTNIPNRNKKLKEALGKIWSCGFLASSLAFTLSKSLGFGNSSELATQALLSYIGNLAMITFQPKLSHSFSAGALLFERVYQEQEDLMTHSAIVGGQLAIEWQLPQEIATAISNSNIPLGVVPYQCVINRNSLPNTVLTYACCRIAEIILIKGIDNLDQINFFAPLPIELFYTPDYLNISGLHQFIPLFASPGIRKEINKLIKKSTAR
ncbi:HDOD domain protein [Legionella waltersii]|uniref:HDOD domain protein n=2 Tax=Legionella waltersii TaxID=66969 RepID=A0A0W1A786_9GAMM|nr:HDOD domain protein [Legionella waltersii]SNV11344.1 HDOD domain [Legionella waltersii]